MQNVVDKQSANHYTWGSLCDSWVLVDTEGLSVKQESMPPGSREKVHFHTHAQQFFFIIKGLAMFYVEGEAVAVNPLQGLLIKPGRHHYVANETNDVLEFLVVSQPTTNADRATL